MKHTVQVEVGGRPLIIECGHVARQASGSVMMRYGDTVVLVAATKEDRVREGIDFVPLMVEYREMSYAAGRIPGGFFRREIGRPSEKETLTSRLDRPSHSSSFPQAVRLRDPGHRHRSLRGPGK